MDDKEFKKRLKKLARNNGIDYRETRQGKSSHSRVYYGEKLTTVRKGEIGTGLLSDMCKQLGITKKDLTEV
jgi:hypothetical protein